MEVLITSIIFYMPNAFNTLYKVFASTENGKHILARLQLSMPIFGNMATKTACARFARQMSTLMAAL